MNHYSTLDMQWINISVFKTKNVMVCVTGCFSEWHNFPPSVLVQSVIFQVFMFSVHVIPVFFQHVYNL